MLQLLISTNITLIVVFEFLETKLRGYKYFRVLKNTIYIFNLFVILTL